MRGAIGNASLLNIIIFILATLLVFFVSVLAYSKAYRAKNRIVEVIEKYGVYDSNVEAEITPFLSDIGYQLGNCKHESDNSTPYKYCVDRIDNGDANGPYLYRVTTYVQFYFPVIGELISPAVTSETRTLGISYDYE